MGAWGHKELDMTEWLTHGKVIIEYSVKTSPRRGLEGLMSLWNYAGVTYFYPVSLSLLIFTGVYLPPTGLPWWLSSKESACRAGAEGVKGSTLESGRFPGGGHGNPLQYFYLENPMDRGALWATVHRVSKTEVTEVHRVGHDWSDLAHMKYNCFTMLRVFLCVQQSESAIRTHISISFQVTTEHWLAFLSYTGASY